MKSVSGGTRPGAPRADRPRGSGCPAARVRPAARPVRRPHPRPHPGYGYPQAHAAPPPYAGPAPVTAPVPGTPTAAPAKTKRNLLLGLTAALLVAGLTGGGVYLMMSGDDAKKDNRARSGDRATTGPTHQDPAAADSTPDEAAVSPGAPSSPEPLEPPEPAVASPAPATYQGIDLTDGYHLTLGDDPVKPLGDDADVDVAYDWNLDKIYVEDGPLILLRAGQKGGLKTCRTETRYAGRVDLDSLSKGSQLCVLTNGGHVGLVTYQGKSPESDPSHYITLDVTVRRGAIAPEAAS
ncbi:hypothetical protein [Streptomyces gobitricini]|uniref:Serine/threonine protein kinase n=1 Tax=Streptomyces gobitricini TaxID=68211 RepID=A0ABP5YXB8_9ACTN